MLCYKNSDENALRIITAEKTVLEALSFGSKLKRYATPPSSGVMR